MSIVGPRDVFTAAGSLSTTAESASAAFEAAPEQPLLKRNGTERMQISRKNRRDIVNCAPKLRLSGSFRQARARTRKGHAIESITCPSEKSKRNFRASDISARPG